LDQIVFYRRNTICNSTDNRCHFPTFRLQSLGAPYIGWRVRDR
jgi:hypothetical protein